MTSGLTSLVVSTSGLQEEMYERLYRSKMYKKVIANIKLLARENIRRGKPIKMMIDMRVDRPMREITAYPDYLEVVELLGAENMLCKFRYDSWAGKITQEELSGNMKLRGNRRPHVTACSEMFGGPMVYWDGKVGACNCRDVNASELIIGDVKKDHLGDIYFGAELKRLRDEFMTDKRKELCRNCTQYNNLTHLLKPSSKGYLPTGPSPYYAKARPITARSGGGFSLPILPDDAGEHSHAHAHAHDVEGATCAVTDATAAASRN
jgi:MoaA/NifB/PqqE/SkfB family radical SAM enzyme